MPDVYRHANISFAAACRTWKREESQYRILLKRSTHLCRTLEGVGVVLEWCWSGVGVVLEWCWSGVGVVLEWCWSGVGVVLEVSLGFKM